MNESPQEAGQPVTPIAERKAATFLPDEKVKVTFSASPVNRREASDEPSDTPFHIVSMDGNDIGEAYPQESGDFDVEIYVTRSAQPYAYQILHAAERFFQTRDISVEYVD